MEQTQRWRTRHATDDDCTALLELVRDMAAHHGEKALADEKRLKTLSDFCTVMVIEDENGRVQGFSAGYRSAEFQHGIIGFEVQNMMMRFEQRRRGHGRKLMRATVAEAVRQGAEKIKLGAKKDNWAARAFYMRLGFVEKDADARFVRCVLEGQALKDLLTGDDEDVRYTGYSHHGVYRTGAVIAVA